jgi:hypothetical protein
MHGAEHFRFVEKGGLKALELPYKDRQEVAVREEVGVAPEAVHEPVLLRHRPAGPGARELVAPPVELTARHVGEEGLRGMARDPEIEPVVGPIGLVDGDVSGTTRRSIALQVGNRQHDGLRRFARPSRPGREPHRSRGRRGRPRGRAVAQQPVHEGGCHEAEREEHAAKPLSDGQCARSLW